MREKAPDNRGKISQNFSPAGVTSPFVARPSSRSGTKEQAFAHDVAV
jgi:hypothetical protein